MTTQIFSFFLLTMGLCSLGGCTVVEPWERGMLAAPNMSLSPDGNDEAFRNHVNDSREGTFGGYGLKGGGCGCN